MVMIYCRNQQDRRVDVSKRGLRVTLSAVGRLVNSRADTQLSRRSRSGSGPWCGGAGHGVYQGHTDWKLGVELLLKESILLKEREG
jgi:hypothetical protein